MLSLRQPAGRRLRTSQLEDRSLCDSPHSSASASRWRSWRPRTPPRVRPRRRLSNSHPRSRQARSQPTRRPQPRPAANPPQQDQQPVPRIRTGINYVRVDAIITDRQGNPVLDLKQDEFRIKEDGKPQAIDSFSVINIDPIAQQMDGPPVREIRSIFEEQREAQRPEVRLFILFLDDYHVRRGNDMVVRKPLIDFVQNQLAPADMVAIMYPLTPITGLTFTRNRASLISAIENFEGRRFDYRPRNEFEEKYAYYPASTVEQIRNQVVMSALKAAAARLGGLREGRKSVIFVSEGFTTILPAAAERAGGRHAGHERQERAAPRLRTATGRSGRRKSTWSRT